MTKKKCDQCGKSFKNLATHVRMKHGSDSNAFTSNNQPSAPVRRSGGRSGRPRGELGRIIEIGQGDPRRGAALYDGYVNGKDNHPTQKDVFVETDAGKVRKIGTVLGGDL